MSLRRVLFATGMAIAVAGCGSGDNSGAVKAHSGIKPGMFIWDALDHADQSQFPDIRFMAWGKDCSHPGVQVGRESGPLYLKVLQQQMDPKYPVSGHAYTQQGFASREEFNLGGEGQGVPIRQL